MHLNFFRVSEAILGISYRDYVIFGFLAVRVGFKYWNRLSVRFGSKKSGFGSVLNIRTENSILF